MHAKHWGDLPNLRKDIIAMTSNTDLALKITDLEAELNMINNKIGQLTIINDKLDRLAKALLELAKAEEAAFGHVARKLEDIKPQRAIITGSSKILGLSPEDTEPMKTGPDEG
jgi:predicted nuclease with TOPRIM domain